MYSGKGNIKGVLERNEQFLVVKVINLFFKIIKRCFSCTLLIFFQVVGVIVSLNRRGKIESWYSST